MCVDYKALNKVTVKNRLSLPHIGNLFDRLRGAHVFSSLVLPQGYHQLHVSPMALILSPSAYPLVDPLVLRLRR